jgi:hypothetical protein
MRSERDEKLSEVKFLIAFYERRGWDWGLPAEFLLQKANGGPLVIRTRIGVESERKTTRQRKVR